MFPKNFDLFQGFMENFQELMLYNTIKSFKEGLTYYDLQQLGNFPHSRIYRLMKRMEEEGVLVKEERVEQGRPKHIYSLSEAGFKKMESLNLNLQHMFDLLKIRVPEVFPALKDFDYKRFLQEGTFKVWCSPVEHVLQMEITEAEKFELLSDMESDISKMLEKVRKERRLLRSKLRIQEKDSEENSVV
jgi:DNA-binding PadR family transcriptional regulator